MSGSGVSSYQYWINENIFGSKKVELGKTENPYNLISLLDIDVEPFCSKRFSFKLEDHYPVIYPKHIFNISMLDPEGNLSHTTMQFTDVRIRKSVDPENISGKVETIIDSVSLGENEIKWYCFDAEPGDSINLNLTHSGMIDMFDPEGKTIVSLSAADAIKGFGTLLMKLGTYYIAVHDLNVDSNDEILGRIFHLNHFAVLNNTPRQASVSGDLFVDVFGNGFDCLKMISLCDNDGRVIHAEKFRAHDRHNLTARFDFKDTSIIVGEYSLKAVFEDSVNRDLEEIIIPKAIVVDNTQKSDIKISVEPSNKPADTYEITVQVSNNSNRICNGVPFYFGAIIPDNNLSMEFKNFYVYSNDEIKPICPHTITDNLLGTGRRGVLISTVIPYIGPYETLSFIIGLMADVHEPVQFYAWAGKPWNEEFEEILSPEYNILDILKQESTNTLTASALSCIYDNYLHKNTDEVIRKTMQCALPEDIHRASDLAQHTADVAQATGMTIGGMINAMRLQRLNMTLANNGYSTEDLGWSDDYAKELKKGIPSPIHILGTAFGYGDFTKYADSIMGKNAQQPTPPHPSHNIDVKRSGDPNDIYGYTSPSGSNFIGKGVKKLVYTVEFENDSTVANAPAMTINVVNKLDGKCLDLNSFIPLNMQIGDKTVDLPAVHHFVITLDMRPETSVIAELKFDYDPATGMAEWQIRSLDPLTMDETEFWYNGILPVNDESGSGQGFLTYSIDLAEGIADNTEISNKAVIVFDNNDPIETPVWTNITDFTAPEVEIQSVSTDDNLTFEFEVISSDDGSGIWYYELYSRERGTESWTARKAMIEQDSFIFTADEPLLDNEFKIVAVDRAGNRSDDIQTDYVIGDADGNGVVNSLDNIIMTNYFLKVIQSINFKACDINKDGTINNLDVIGATNIYLNSKN